MAKHINLNLHVCVETLHTEVLLLKAQTHENGIYVVSVMNKFTVVCNSNQIN
jgi:hypothetical protein